MYVCMLAWRGEQVQNEVFEDAQVTSSSFVNVISIKTFCYLFILIKINLHFSNLTQTQDMNRTHTLTLRHTQETQLKHKPSQKLTHSHTHRHTTKYQIIRTLIFFLTVYFFFLGVLFFCCFSFLFYSSLSCLFVCSSCWALVALQQGRTCQPLGVFNATLWCE